MGSSSESERDWDATRDFLFSLRNTGSRFGIERMSCLAGALGHPERAYPVIHVAGTNGKGSTCAMIDSALRNNGYRTGMTVSPHLVYVGERIQIDRQSLPRERIVEWVARIERIGREIAQADPAMFPTFFEFVTAMAFLEFREQRVDVAVIETGLGGRLDATNVVRPAVCVITSIGFDHEAILGNTLDAIAREKAGIIKPGAPVVIGLLPSEAEKAIREVAERQGCELRSIRDRFPSLHGCSGLGDARFEQLPQTNLAGGFQRLNAAVAQLTLETVAGVLPTDPACNRQGFRNVDWPGRWQTLSVADGKRVVLDATHNEEGLAALRQNLGRLVHAEGIFPHIVCGILGSKRAISLIPLLAQFAKSLTFVAPQQPRACPPSELRALVPSSFAGTVSEGNVSDLFFAGSCRLGEPGTTVLVTGSIYLLGEVLGHLRPDFPADSDLTDVF